MDSITTQLKAETEELMWKYLDAFKRKDGPEEKRLYDEIMLRCGLIKAAGEDLEGVGR